MPLVPDLAHEELRSKAALRIKAGALPVIVPKQLFAGYGTGEPCAVCGQPIARKQTLYEVADEVSRRALAMHFVCYAEWQHECMTALGGVSRYRPSVGADLPTDRV